MKTRRNSDRPSLSYGLGFGLNVNYVDVTLTNAIDFAAICARQTGAVCPYGALPGQGRFDGFVDNSGDDVSYGYNPGLLWEISPATRVGLCWRSGIKHELEGDADFTSPDSLGGFTALGPLGAVLGATLLDTDIEADLDLTSRRRSRFLAGTERHYRQSGIQSPFLNGG